MEEITVSPERIKKYLEDGGTRCPLEGCDGFAIGTGEQEWLDGASEIAVGYKCDACGAEWDEFFAPVDISVVTRYK